MGRLRSVGDHLESQAEINVINLSPSPGWGAPSRVEKQWNWRRWSGWVGSTIDGCWSPLGIFNQRRPKPFTIANSPSQPRRRDSNQRASEISGTVQFQPQGLQGSRRCSMLASLYVR